MNTITFNEPFVLTIAGKAKRNGKQQFNKHVPSYNIVQYNVVPCNIIQHDATHFYIAKYYFSVQEPPRGHPEGKQ